MSFLMNKVIKNCRKCHILDSQSGSPLCEADVLITKSDEIELTFSGWKPDLKSVYKQPVIFYDSVNGLVTCSCNLCEIRPLTEKAGFYHAVCQIESVQDLMDRHEDFRLTLSLAVTIQYLDAHGRKNSTVGLTKNISAGGIYVMTAEKLPSKDIVLHFIQNVLPISPRAAVLREELLENGKYGYGCRFVQLSPYTESLLRGYIFQMETIHRKNPNGS